MFNLTYWADYKKSACIENHSAVSALCFADFGNHNLWRV